MEVLVTVDNFEQGAGSYREINSPRTLEACLRSGLDPSELYPRSKRFFREKNLTPEMLNIKFDTFERKRHGKIHCFFFHNSFYLTLTYVVFLFVS